MKRVGEEDGSGRDSWIGGNDESGGGGGRGRRNTVVTMKVRD